ncbi:MAG: Txe/YoeB family addiction module toxin [Acidobacteria bacterium]|nr:Txe/YoeB family addiction module toxin [Acidobacteriota bacterium]MBA3785269.1 Txe/YoeB family addiction module toxin [Acidobacteriota bacterium]MBA4124544.1 Txe/YoeB family addiction module toxin [Acidobacteriota bacterium]MBA4185077.1 Txe/YoeB family addiction module toxin [Acidobacteriota bacterium]
MNWTLIFSKQALKDAKRLKRANLWKNAENLFNILRQNPFQNPPPYEKLVGDLEGVFSRRINIQHRLIYQTNEREKTIRVLRMWTHYE